MRIVRGDASLRRWVEKRVHEVDCLGPSENLAVVDSGGKILAGVIFHNFRWPSIEATIAAADPRWCVRTILRQLMEYPFSQLKCGRITVFVHEANARSLRLTRGVGFVEEGLMRGAAQDGGNLILFGMTKQDFERGKYGQPPTQTAGPVPNGEGGCGNQSHQPIHADG